MKNLLFTILFGIAVAAQAQTPTPTPTPTATPTPLIFGKIPVSTYLPSAWSIAAGQLVAPGGGSYISNNTARVDPSGNDSTGTVGDLAKPFLTIQAALTSLEAQGGFTQTQPAVVMIPTNDTTENVTTSLQYLVLIGRGTKDVGDPAIGTITLTNSVESDTIFLGLNNLWVNGISSPNLPASSTLQVNLYHAVIAGDCTTTGAVRVVAPYSTGTMTGTIAPGAGLQVSVVGLAPDSNANGLPVDIGNGATINAPGSSVAILNSYIYTITAQDVQMQDSRFNYITSITGTLSTSDIFLNPASMDFSTLPTSDQFDGKHAWVDSNLFIKLSSTPTPTPSATATPTP